jgi:hypothetical protein
MALLFPIFITIVSVLFIGSNPDVLVSPKVFFLYYFAVIEKCINVICFKGVNGFL